MERGVNVLDMEKRVDKGGGGGGDPGSVDIIDLLPSDPFGMDIDISTTFTAINGWLEDLDADFGVYGRNSFGNTWEDYGLFSGINLIMNHAMRFQSFPSNEAPDVKGGSGFIVENSTTGFQFSDVMNHAVRFQSFPSNQFHDIKGGSGFLVDNSTARFQFGHVMQCSDDMMGLDYGSTSGHVTMSEDHFDSAAAGGDTNEAFFLAFFPAILARPQPPPPPPLAFISSNGGSVSNYLGISTPLPPPSPGLSLGFSKSTFTYEELAMATDGFSEDNLLGQGGFGFVNRGVLPNGKEVAVKQLKTGSGQGEREFQAQIEIISRVHHKHLVSLVGYSMTGAQRLLVYEFVPNNTMEFHLYGKNRLLMEFPTRLRIALGAAKGLAYLHEDCHPKTIHRDIKAANILFDFNFEAKIADFSLAKITFEVATHVSTRVMGTFGSRVSCFRKADR